MNGNLFRDYKKIYTDITVPDAEIEQKWQMLSDILPEQDLPRSSYHFMPYGAVFFSAVLVLLVGTIGLAQASKPGSLLYPAHAVTQEVAKGVTSVFQSKENHVTPPKIHTAVTTPMLPTLTVKPTITPTPQLIQKGELKNFHSKNSSSRPQTNVLGSQTEKEDTHSPTPNVHSENSDSSSHIRNSEDRNDTGNGKEGN